MLCVMLILLVIPLEFKGAQLKEVNMFCSSDSLKLAVFKNQPPHHASRCGANRTTFTVGSPADSAAATITTAQKNEISEVSTEKANPAPNHFELFQNFPNPFNSNTFIKIELGSDSFVSLNVFDVRGQPVARLVNSFQPAGTYIVPWDGLDSKGDFLSSGVYYYRLIAEDFQDVKRLVLLR